MIESLQRCLPTV